MRPMRRGREGRFSEGYPQTPFSGTLRAASALRPTAVAMNGWQRDRWAPLGEAGRRSPAGRARRRRGKLQDIDNFMCLSALPLPKLRVMIKEPLGPRLIEPVLIPDGAPFPQYT